MMSMVAVATTLLFAAGFVVIKISRGEIEF